MRNKPAGDAFGSNRRSPTLMRRRREEINAAKDVASNQAGEETYPGRSLSTSPRSGNASPRSGNASPRSGSASPTR